VREPGYEAKRGPGYEAKRGPKYEAKGRPGTHQWSDLSKLNSCCTRDCGDQKVAGRQRVTW